VANITTTNIDLGGVIIELWGQTSGVLRNAAVSEQTFAPGTLLARHATDGKFYPYDPAETSEDIEVPKYILTYEVVAAASSDNQVQAMSAGKFDQNRIVVHDGTPVTAGIIDQLMNRTFVAIDVKQLARIDNPQ
jgi:hypothetical protein